MVLELEKVIAPDEYIQGDLISLRLAVLNDCSENYLAWLLDSEVNCYLETRWHDQTMESIRHFVGGLLDDPFSYLFAIVENETKRHIGNIKLGPINPYHAYADVSYFIGEKKLWGKGYATQAIRLVTQFAFEKLKLHRLQAGIYASNQGSGRALEKAGYKLEAVFKKQLKNDSGWEDHYFFAALNEVRK